MGQLARTWRDPACRRQVERLGERLECRHRRERRRLERYVPPPPPPAASCPAAASAASTTLGGLRSSDRRWRGVSSENEARLGARLRGKRIGAANAIPGIEAYARRNQAANVQGINGHISLIAG